MSTQQTYYLLFSTRDANLRFTFLANRERAKLPHVSRGSALRDRQKLSGKWWNFRRRLDPGYVCLTLSCSWTNHVDAFTSPRRETVNWICRPHLERGETGVLKKLTGEYVQRCFHWLYNSFGICFSMGFNALFKPSLLTVTSLLKFLRYWFEVWKRTQEIRFFHRAGVTEK